jgi:hypothetical protein
MSNVTPGYIKNFFKYKSNKAFKIYQKNTQIQNNPSFKLMNNNELLNNIVAFTAKF